MITKLLRRAVKVFWLLPGLLLWASFPPMGERADCFFALAPLLWLCRNRDWRTNARRWFLNGIVFWVATLSWMPAIVKNGGPWPLVLLGWGGLAAYCALYFALFGAVNSLYWGWANDKPSWGRRLFGLLFVEPVLWAGFEIVRSRFLGGFSWNQLGVAPINAGFGSPAAIGGVYLVSAVVILVNGTIASIAERMLDGMRPEGPARFGVPRWVRSAETLVPFLLIWGLYQLPGMRLAEDPNLGSLKVAMIQRNFPCCFQGPRENPYPVYSNLVSKVEMLRPELIVLPESAMCEFSRIDRPNALYFANWLARDICPVLAGGSRMDKEGREYNSAALYTGCEIKTYQDLCDAQEHATDQVYDKVHLVPFGEFIPGDKLFPWLQRFAPVGSCTPGKGNLLALNDRPFGVAICYEDTDSALMRQCAAAGARFLCFITNDSWFSHSNEAVAHSWQAVARAIETGLPVVRVGNSGVTGTITCEGKASWLIGEGGKPLVDAQGTMFDRISVPSHPLAPTPYVVLGDMPLFIAFILLILAMILVKYKHYYEKRRHLSM